MHEVDYLDSPQSIFRLLLGYKYFGYFSEVSMSGTELGRIDFDGVFTMPLIKIFFWASCWVEIL